MKADHNARWYNRETEKLFPMVQRYLNESRPQPGFSSAYDLITVSNGSKILKWKQTTTDYANLYLYGLLFPMVQRYLNESRPQQHGA